MPITVYGNRLFGQVDRISGLCYVSTIFWHVQWVPLIPLRSYIVLEGSEDGDGFVGIRIPLRLKSAVIGYLRGWMGAVAVFGAGVSGAAVSAFFLGHKHSFAVISGLTTAGVFVCSVWFILTTHTPYFVLVQGVFHGLAALIWLGYVWFIEPNPAPFQDKLPELRCWPYLAAANVALVLFSMTRLWTHAGAKRTGVLLKELEPISVEGESNFEWVMLSRLGEDDSADWN